MTGPTHATGHGDAAHGKGHADEAETVKAFKDLVNMSAGQIDKWLDTEDSKKVGQKSSEGAESTGHQSGKKIIEILGKKAGDYSDADYQHMHKVVSYIKRHMAQKPEGDVTDTPWRYSLMNWGHDPLKK